MFLIVNTLFLFLLYYVQRMPIFKEKKFVFTPAFLYDLFDCVPRISFV